MNILIKWLYDDEYIGYVRINDQPIFAVTGEIITVTSKLFTFMHLTKYYQ